MTDYDLCVITRSQKPSKKLDFSSIKEAIAGGATVVRLSGIDSSDSNIHDSLKALAKYCFDCGVLLILDDYAELALLAECDGVHLTKESMPVSEVRNMVPPEFIIGLSISSLNELRDAEMSGADYLAVPISCSTSDEVDFNEGVSLETFAEIKSSTFLPVLATGCINADLTKAIFSLGADGVMVPTIESDEPREIVGAIVDIKNAIKELRGKNDSQQNHSPFEMHFDLSL